MRVLGSIAAIWRYPTKSLAAQELAAAQIQSDGLAGDRTDALVVERGHARTGKTYRGKEQPLLHTLPSAGRAVELASHSGVEVRVDRAMGRYFDAAPVSILFDSWLLEASALAGYTLEPLRYRPNFYVTAVPPFDSEAALVGRLLQAGTATLRVRSPIERCVTTTYDLRTGESDPKVLRAVVQNRGGNVGIYCDVVATGTVTRDDDLLVADDEARR